MVISCSTSSQFQVYYNSKSSASKMTNFSFTIPLKMTYKINCIKFNSYLLTNKRIYEFMTSTKCQPDPRKKRKDEYTKRNILTWNMQQIFPTWKGENASKLSHNDIGSIRQRCRDKLVLIDSFTPGTLYFWILNHKRYKQQS